MQQTVVKASLGRQTGSRASRRLRAEGKLPGVVYGFGKEPRSIAVEYTDLRAALTGHAGMNALLTLDIDGDQETVLVREVQRDPIKRWVTHADFMRIDPDQKVRLNVPIELVGEATAVLEAGAMVEQAMFEIEVEVSPNRIPDQIKVDISSLTPDSRISVADLELPDGVESMVEDVISVVVPVVSRAAKVAGDEEGAEGQLDEVEDGAEGDGESDDASADEEE